MLSEAPLRIGLRDYSPANLTCKSSNKDPALAPKVPCVPHVLPVSSLPSGQLSNGGRSPSLVNPCGVPFLFPVALEFLVEPTPPALSSEPPSHALGAAGCAGHGARELAGRAGLGPCRLVFLHPTVFIHRGIIFCAHTQRRLGNFPENPGLPV